MRFTGPPYPTMPYFYSHVIKNIRLEEVPFVDDHLKYITLYKNRISKATGKMLKDSTYQVTFKVELVKVHADSAGRETKQPIFAPIEVGLLVAEKGQSQKKVLSIEKLNLKNGQLVVMRSKVKPRFATIDPLYKLIDIDMADNQREIDWE